MPLAVELAAAWSRTLSPRQIADGLDDRFTLLVGAADHPDPRQRTLLASVEWSYDLLDTDAQVALARLAVCAGEFDLDTMIAVAGADLAAPLATLRELVDASMVEVAAFGDGHRYRLLDTIRAFAADRLTESREADAIRDRHLVHFRDRAVAAAVRLEMDDQDATLDDLCPDRENFRAALRWSEARGDGVSFRALARALVGLWLLDGTAGEGLEVLRRALATVPDEPSAATADLWSGVALLAMPAGHIDEIPAAAARALELALPAGDDAAIARAYVSGCYTAFYNDYPRCEELARRAQAHAVTAGASATADLALMFEMVAFGNRDRYDVALPISEHLFARADACHRRLPTAIARNLGAFGALLTGDVPHAVTLARDAVRIARPLRDHFIAGTCTATLAWTLGVNGRVRQGLALMDALVRSVDRAVGDVDVVDLSISLGKLYVWAGRPDEAITCLLPVSQFDEPGPDNWTVSRALPALAAAFRHAGRTDDARRAAERGIAVAERLGTVHTLAESLDELGHLARLDDIDDALDRYHRAIELRRSHDLRTQLCDSIDHLAAIAVDVDEPDEAARLSGAADSAHDHIGYPRPAVDLREHRFLRRAVHEALGAEEGNTAISAGRALDLDAAIGYVTRRRGPRNRPETGWASLTPTEQEVVALVAEGRSNPEIAERLFMSRATVKSHLRHVYTKLGISNRVELAAAAVTRRAGHGTTNI